VEVFRKLKHDFNLMYFCPDANEREKKAIGLPDIEKYCKENEISWISFTKQGFDAEAAKVFKKAEINMCVFSYGTAGEIRNAVDMGADLVGTHYMNPRELNTLQI
jgi:hypothetical protein